MAAAAIMAIAGLAGCSGMTAAQGRANAAEAGNQVLPQARAIYQKLYSNHVGWAYSLDANYIACSATSELSYHNYLDPVIAFPGVSSASFQQDILRIVRSEGWKYTLDDKDMPAGDWAVHYDMSKGVLKGDIAMAGSSALLRFFGPCFNGGPAWKSIDPGGNNISVPHPSPVPSG